MNIPSHPQHAPPPHMHPPIFPQHGTNVLEKAWVIFLWEITVNAIHKLESSSGLLNRLEIVWAKMRLYRSRQPCCDHRQSSLPLFKGQKLEQCRASRRLPKAPAKFLKQRRDGRGKQPRLDPSAITAGLIPDRRRLAISMWSPGSG